MDNLQANLYSQKALLLVFFSFSLIDMHNCPSHSNRGIAASVTLFLSLPFHNIWPVRICLTRATVGKKNEKKHNYYVSIIMIMQQVFFNDKWVHKFPIITNDSIALIYIIMCKTTFALGPCHFKIDVHLYLK